MSCEDLMTTSISAARLLRLVVTRAVMVRWAVVGRDEHQAYLSAMRLRKKRAKALSDDVASPQSSQFSGESWQYVLLLPPCHSAITPV